VMGPMGCTDSRDADGWRTRGACKQCTVAVRDAGVTVDVASARIFVKAEASDGQVGVVTDRAASAGAGCRRLGATSPLGGWRTRRGEGGL